VSACFNDTNSTSATTLAVDPASGTFGGTTSLSATLTSNGSPVANESVAFTLNGTGAGSAQTNSSGVATLPPVSLSGIGAGSYPTGVGASFAGDTGLDPSSGSAALTVSKAAQTISVTTHAPASAVYNTGFSVAATGGGSGNPVTFSSSGGCSNAGGSFTMTSGTTACQVKYDQAGSSNYDAAPEVTETVIAVKADAPYKTLAGFIDAAYRRQLAVQGHNITAIGDRRNRRASTTMSSASGAHTR